MYVSFASRFHDLHLPARRVNCHLQFARQLLNLLNFANINGGFEQRHFIRPELDFPILVRELFHSIPNDVVFLVNQLL